MSDVKNRVAIVPGSFDPITAGHLSIVRRAAREYDKVYLAVMINPDKKYMFTLSERVRIAEAATTEIDNVEVISSEGYLWELARDLGAVALVKGVRNETDREYELKMAEYNKAHYSEAETVMLPTEPEYADLSSTLIREKLASGEDISEYLPEEAIEVIKEINSSKEKGLFS